MNLVVFVFGFFINWFGNGNGFNFEEELVFYQWLKMVEELWERVF